MSGQRTTSREFRRLARRAGAQHARVLAELASRRIRGHRVDVALLTEPADVWVGVYWRTWDTLYVNYRAEVYVCLLPCLPVRVRVWRKDAR